ncbi:hypothetical protein BH11BAC6_BH11BAC6_14220 [soil metagenome]
MQAILQSAFLQALGYAIFNSLWQIALLWIIVMIINSVGKLSSASKYFVAVVAHFGGFIWFVFTLKFYYSECSVALEQSAGVPMNDYYFYEPVVNNFSSGMMWAIIKIEQLLPYLSAAYLFMLLFLSARLTKAFFYAKKIRTRGLQKASVDLRLFVKKTAGYLGINKEVTLYFSELVSCPLTLGFLKPLILVPIASINQLTTDQLEAVLLHELAHIKRADYLINILQSIIEITLFFNPFTQLLGKLIKKERENSCDDWVLQFQYQPAMYAEALLRIAYIQSQPTLAMQATGDKAELLPRVKRMLNQQEKKHQYRNHLFALVLITIMFTTVAWFNPVAHKVQSNNTAIAAGNKKMIIEPFTTKIDNAFYNPMYWLTKPIKDNLEESINIAADKIAETAIPVAENATDIVSKVTPIAMESLREAGFDLQKELPNIQAETAKAMDQAKVELKKININGVNFNDSSFGNALNAMVQTELSKIDWTQMNKELAKAQQDLLTTAKDQEANGATQVLTNLQNVSVQLKQLNNNKKAIDASGLLKTLFEKKKEVIKQQQELDQIKQQEKKEVRVTAIKRPLRVWSDLASEDYGAVAAYPVTYSSVGYNQSYAAAPEPDAAVIIVNHYPENDSSHTKKITVQIAGDKGVVKSYTFTVEVYQ